MTAACRWLLQAWRQVQAGGWLYISAVTRDCEAAAVGSRKLSEPLVHAKQESAHESPASPRGVTDLRAAHLQRPSQTCTPVRGRRLRPPGRLQCATAARQSAAVCSKNPGSPPPRGRAAPARHRCLRHLGSGPRPRPARLSCCPGRGPRGATGHPGHPRPPPPRLLRPHRPQAGAGGAKGDPPPAPPGPRPRRHRPPLAPAAARPGPGYLGGPGEAAPPAAARSRARCRSYRPARPGLHHPGPGPGPSEAKRRDATRRPRLGNDLTAAASARAPTPRRHSPRRAGTALGRRAAGTGGRPGPSPPPPLLRGRPPPGGRGQGGARPAVGPERSLGTGPAPPVAVTAVPEGVGSCDPEQGGSSFLSPPP